jgi:HK97 family phage major capsid protein
MDNVDVKKTEVKPPEIAATDDPMQKMAQAISAIKEQLAAGVPHEQIAGIVRDQLKLLEADRRSKAVPEDNVDGKAIKSLDEVIEKATKDPDLINLQEKSDEVYIMSKYLHTHPKNLKSYSELQQAVKAVQAGGSAGTGVEWIPTGFSARLWEKVRLELKVGSLFEEIPMPANPFKCPVLLGDMTAYLVPESASDEVVTTATIPPSQPLSANITLTAKKIAARVRVSDEATEDSLIPMMTVLKDNIAKAVGYGIETALINGDTATTHMDADVTNAKDARKSWDGLRKLSPSSTARIDISTYNEAALRSLRKAMGVYGVNPQNIAWIMGISGYLQTLGLPGVMTMEKYGPNATILTGELAKFDGAPIIVSEAIRQDLNATGVYDGTTKTKTIILCVHRSAFLRGLRRGFTIQQGQDIENGQGILVASVRVAFNNVYATTANAVATGFNLTA